MRCQQDGTISRLKEAHWYDPTKICVLLFILSDNRINYFTIALVCASVLIGLIIICLAFSLYTNWKQRKAIAISTPNQNVNDVNDAGSSKSSSSSIYDEIEFYESARTERAHPASPHTVMTRDPYAYDEIFGLQRIAILPENPEQKNKDTTHSISGLKVLSLPIDLNKVGNYDIENTDAEYVDMLPEKLEPCADRIRHVNDGMQKSKSINDVVKP